MNYMHEIPWINFAIFFPIVFGFFILSVQSDNKLLIKWIALLGSFLSFLVTIPIYLGFEKNTSYIQFEQNLAWIESCKANYHIGVDGISVWFILLTAFITFLVILISSNLITERLAHYMSAFLIMNGLMIGAFSALDGMLFYMFFECTLIPMYIIIGTWGGKNRIYAALKFFLYTLFGSLFMLAGFIYLRIISGSFEIFDWHFLEINKTQQLLIFSAFLIAFAIKIPMWPLHTWLPDVHVEAPTGGSVILAAIMLKLGAYGFLRIAIPISPDIIYFSSKFLIASSLIAIVYAGLIAMTQDNMKSIVAYSSIVHMGLVTLGIFLLNKSGIEGAIIQMLSHGLISAAMFISVGILYRKTGSLDLGQNGGIASVMPKFSVFFVFFSLANAGLPGTSGFVGEFLIILGAVKNNLLIALIAASILIIGASYSLRMIKCVIFGNIQNQIVKKSRDIFKVELLVFSLITFSILLLGLFPRFFTDLMHISIDDLLNHVSNGKNHVIP